MALITADNLISRQSIQTDPFDIVAGTTTKTEGLSWEGFVAAISTSFILFIVQVTLFYVLRRPRTGLSYIYAPKTFLVTDRELVPSPPDGFIAWLKPIFRTPSKEFIEKNGLDAYMFLRFIRMLLRITVPLACIILPILLPINYYGGNDEATGLDQLAWAHVGEDQTQRYWAHLLLACLVVIWTCYVCWEEIRRFVRLRQFWMTSPHHRIRASATTVLISNVPRKWLTERALRDLFDAYGDVRNIWINRNYDELEEKVLKRNNLARGLEKAETELIRNAKRQSIKAQEQEAKQAGIKKTRKEKKQDQAEATAAGERMANQSGHSSGDPHQAHTIAEILGGVTVRARSSSTSSEERRGLRMIPLVGQGFGAVEQGIGLVGQGVNKLGRAVASNVVGGFNGVRGVFDPRQRPSNQEPETQQSSGPAGPMQPSTTNSGSLGHQYDGQYGGLNPRPGNGDLSMNPYMEHSGSRTMNYASGTGDISTCEAGPGPQPAREDDEFPLTVRSPTIPSTLNSPTSPQNTIGGPDEYALRSGSHYQDPTIQQEKPKQTHITSSSDNYEEADEDAVWRRYIKPKDRETMRMDRFHWSWLPDWLPSTGRKVDKIYYLRAEVAKLNQEIERDQQESEKFPLMNSAFIQFYAQASAHMACQSIAHHRPNMMDPRMVELDPGDVRWSNLSLVWWQRKLRSVAVFTILLGITILYAIPMGFIGLLSQFSTLADNISWLRWLEDIPVWLTSVLQGALPPLLATLFLVFLPMLFRLLIRWSGAPTGTLTELSLQGYWFTFLFIVYVIVISLSSGLTSTVQSLIEEPYSTPGVLAQNLPKASNYFFTYLLLQCFGITSGTLAQIPSLLNHFLWGKMFDSTAREKFNRKITLQPIPWGSFFPIYTVIGCITIIYSVIAPLVLIFSTLTFCIFWVVYRYEVMYVYRFMVDSGGRFFPRAVNQLFTGIYVFEICLIGLFFLVRNREGNVVCVPHAVIMIVFLVGTVLFQIQLNRFFGELILYMPVTMEDEAAARLKEYEVTHEDQPLNRADQEGGDVEAVLKQRDKKEQEEEKVMEDIEMKEIEKRRSHDNTSRLRGESAEREIALNPTSAVPTAHRQPLASDNDATASNPLASYPPASPSPQSQHHHQTPAARRLSHLTNRLTAIHAIPDVEAQHSIATHLFSGYNDELEDFTPEERNKLVQQAFLHPAIKAKRPAVWIPQDGLGVTEDEIRRTEEGYQGRIWVSSAFCAVKTVGRRRKVKVEFSRPPPDWDELEFIKL
ncbi:sporulation-specific protein 75 [Coniosporium tulheliwenetii]|uniref:Sporulation-specific protein 75 n=1 Tax=Coniosporium tulheliwenetii TaxID=3383036 RepID=A0ACC2YJB1_9PEZI|nr:sporulation-specific protein 75 [Cladosporium sp. JES 115]